MAIENLVKGLVAGCLAGIAIGLLYAPKSGSQTREDLAKSAKRLCEKAKDGYEQALHDAEGLVEHGKAVCCDGERRLKKAIDAGVETFHETAKT